MWAGETTPRIDPLPPQAFYARAGFLGYVAGQPEKRALVPHLDLPAEIIVAGADRPGRGTGAGPDERRADELLPQRGRHWRAVRSRRSWPARPRVAAPSRG